ncbi:vWA domain-containing protein [Fusobacterium polymorphum]|uniref:vWA domain-containing protein n=1 Tax=Fusobacterium nucleatum subsp. polymorphum TaxID=76857 RepID=UPI0030CEF826
MKNNEKVFLLIDTSGSMIENEKSSILMYIYRPFKTIIGDRLLAYSWGDEIKEISKVSELKMQGKINNETTEKFLNNLEENSHLVIMSDGSFETDIFKKLEKKVNIYFVGIGSDVDKKILEYTFGKNNYFEAYDILNLANWLKMEIS